MSSSGTDGPTVTLYAEFTARKGCRDEVAALLATLTEQVRAEPGNLRFDASCRADDPNSFFVYEAYRDAAAFSTHLGAPHGAVFNTALHELIVGDGSTLTHLRPL